MARNHSVYCTICLSVLVTCTGFRDAAASIPPAYHVTDLGTLGGEFTAGTGINASGQVAGYSFTPDYASVHAFLWTPTTPNGVCGTLNDLGPGAAYDINDSAQVTGHSDPGYGAGRAFLYDGTMHDLGTLGGTSSEGYGVNASGQVTGRSSTTEGVAHVFLYDGMLHDLGSLGGADGYGSGINDSGQVTGTSSTGIDLHAFLWTPSTPNGATGTMSDLGTLGGAQSGGVAINNIGQVVGYSNLPGDTAYHAFLYDGTMHDLGTLGGADSYGSGINSSGQVVGNSLLAGGVRHAFLYTSASGMVDLNSLIDPLSGWELNAAYAINDAGQITGFGQFAAGETRAFLLTPIPEPAGLVLAGLGILALRIRRLRRLTPSVCVGCALSLATVAQAAPYIVTDLGVAGADNTTGWGINASGQVTGYASTAGEDTVTGYVWVPTTANAPTGSLHRLGVLDGDFSWGFGINAAGQVSGIVGTVDGTMELASLWIPLSPNGPTGTMYDLGTLGGTFSQGTGINDSGQLTGYADLAGDEESHAMIWKPTAFGGSAGTMYDLGTLGGTQSFGWDINASGQVTGDSSTTDDEATHAMLWKPAVPNGTTGTMHDLGTLGGTTSDGVGINDKGQVAGYSMTTDDEATHAFLWTPTTPGGVTGIMLDLGTLGGADSYALEVTNSGRVVGASAYLEFSSNYRAFLYTRSAGMVDLNDLIDPNSGWELENADDINDSGQISGQGRINDELHAFLLTPSLPGDFDFDEDVDGEDFLIWQRGESHEPLSAKDLADWETNYGTEPELLTATSTYVPEPATSMLAAVGLCAPFVRRRCFPRL